jgi:hypothetical protein
MHIKFLLKIEYWKLEEFGCIDKNCTEPKREELNRYTLLLKIMQI